MTVTGTFFENMPYNAISNKELQDILKQYPGNAIVCIEYCNIREMTYDSNKNLIMID